jgi:putative hemolysin
MLMHDSDSNNQVLGRIGMLDVVLAQRPRDIRRAQRLRYAVFHREMAACSDWWALLTQRDCDEFDLWCDHLLVRQHGRGILGLRRIGIVGTYRLLRQEAAAEQEGFYSARQFDLSPMLNHWPDARFLEFGRSCVAPLYRDKRTVELLWHGIWAYVLRHKTDVVFGCVSLEGTDPEALALQLSYLHHFHRAPEEWCPHALPVQGINMDRIARNHIDIRKVMRLLPPLIKGYLRLGAYIGEGAVIDQNFGTTDVMVILPVSMLNPRYIHYYGANAPRRAAS